MVMVTILIKLQGYSHSSLVRITAQEVKNITVYDMILYNTPLFPVSGVTIVAGGAALMAATTLAATSFSPVLSLIIGEININIYTG